MLGIDLALKVSFLTYCAEKIKGLREMLRHDQVLKVTLEINQDTNLDELMAHLCLMQKNVPVLDKESDLLVDFSIHEGELSQADMA
jgi:hypothetical protein